MKKALTAAFIIVLALAGTVGAGQFYGGRSFLQTQCAVVLPPGTMEFTSYLRGYTGPVKGQESNGSSALKAAFGLNRQVRGISVLAAAYGYNEHVEFGLTQVLSQALNSTPGNTGEATNSPGNTYIRVKAAGYPLGENLFWGYLGALRFPAAKLQNVHLEPYQGKGTEIELNGLLSYYVKPLYMDEAPSFHLNLGYLNQTDASALNYVASVMIPRPRYDYGVEFYGNLFLKQPPVSILGRENWMYVSPMARYKLFKGLTFTAGLDLLMLGRTDTSIPTTNPLANYSTWRISGKISFTPSTVFNSSPSEGRSDAPTSAREKRSYAGSDATKTQRGSGAPMLNRQELSRYGVEERGGDIQSVDLDLEKLRQERKKVEEQLKALKAKLEERQKAEPQK